MSAIPEVHWVFPKCKKIIKETTNRKGRRSVKETLTGIKKGRVDYNNVHMPIDKELCNCWDYD